MVGFCQILELGLKALFLLVEEGRPRLVVEEAEHGRHPVEGAEATEEPGVVDEAAPVLGDEGGAEEVDRLRREVQEDLQKKVVRGKREMKRRRRRAGQVDGELVHVAWELGEKGSCRQFLFDFLSHVRHKVYVFL